MDLMLAAGRFLRGKLDIEVTVRVTYTYGTTETYVTVWNTRKSTEKVASIVRGWFNSGCHTVDIEGTNPVVINLHRVVSCSVSAREL